MLLISFMGRIDPVECEMIFSFSRIRNWLDCFIAFNNYRDHTYKRYRRVLLLLNDNYIGEAGPWRIFPSVRRPVPESADLLVVSNAYEDYLQSRGYAEETIYIRMSFACRFLCCLESAGIRDIGAVTAFTVSKCFWQVHMKERLIYMKVQE